MANERMQFLLREGATNGHAAAPARAAMNSRRLVQASRKGAMG